MDSARQPEMRTFDQEYRRSIDNQEQFWADQAQDIDWFKAPSTILSKDENGIDRWFADGELNSSYLALDVHVKAGRGDQTALIYDSPVTKQKAQYTYQQLLDEVATLAGAMQELGVSKGDRVLIYMPMIPQAAIAMLACARLGAIHSVVFGGFAAHELAVRIDDATPKLVLSASCGIEVDKILPYKPLLNKAIEESSHTPEHTVIWQRAELKCELKTDGNYQEHDWVQLVTTAKPVDAVAVKANDPLYILYTSGTTGTPKGVVRDNGGHAVALKYSMKAIYDQQPGDVFWAASDVGWVVGHSYIVYAPLFAGLTTVFYEGKPVMTPDAGAFWRVCEEYKVKALFAAPTAFRAVRKEDPECKLAEQYDLSALKYIFMAGERLDPPTYDWVDQHIQRPIIDHWWQTETGWAIAGNPAGIELFPAKAGSVTKPSSGFDVQILDSKGQPVANGEQGNIAVKLPLPPSCLPTIWGNHERFEAGYLNTFKGYYVTGDGGYYDDDGYLYVMGRTDDIINVAGHRLSTGEMEEVIAGHQAVAECAVIGTHCDLKGEQPLGLVIIKDGVAVEGEQLQAELVQEVRKKIGAVASLKRILVVSRLPKTRSGKILRKILRAIANGESFQVPSTIDDPNCLKEIKQLMQEQRLMAS